MLAAEVWNMYETGRAKRRPSTMRASNPRQSSKLLPEDQNEAMPLERRFVIFETYQEQLSRSLEHESTMRSTR
jgi:hypothetical protein